MELGKIACSRTQLFLLAILKQSFISPFLPWQLEQHPFFTNPIRPPITSRLFAPATNVAAMKNAVHFLFIRCSTENANGLIKPMSFVGTMGNLSIPFPFRCLLITTQKPIRIHVMAFFVLLPVSRLSWKTIPFTVTPFP